MADTVYLRVPASQALAEARINGGGMAFRCTVHGGPDREGKWFYTLHWWADYHPGHPDGEYRWAERGQCFQSTLPDWVQAQMGAVS